MTKSKAFFEKPDAIVSAIRKAEMKTSGEIKVHVETHNEKPLTERAIEVFHFLKMDKLPHHNGVLIFISVYNRGICILGDEKINEVVGNGFWNDTVFQVVSYFKENKFDNGVIHAIYEIGRKLEMYFPADTKHNPNELNDDISFGS